MRFFLILIFLTVLIFVLIFIASLIFNPFLFKLMNAQDYLGLTFFMALVLGPILICILGLIGIAAIFYYFWKRFKK